MQIRPWFCLFLCLFLCLGCSEDPQRKALEPLSKATLTPGKGLGKLELGVTTLDDVVQEVGPGFVSILVSDEAVYEMVYLQRQLCLGFAIDKKSAGDARKLSADVKALMAANPESRKWPLTSISVGGSEDAFFQGATDKGVRLGSPATEAAVHDEDARVGQVLAGSSPRNGEIVATGEGIRLWRLSKEADGPITRITVFK